MALRDALRWSTQGAWVEGMPESFQWLGLAQSAWPAVVVIITMLLAAALAWGLHGFRAGRSVIAVGSNREAARLIGIHTDRVTFSVFAITGFVTGLSAALNAVRFNQIPSNAGLGLEMKVIAAVVVGGASISGGRGGVFGTLLGVVLLAMIGPALTFLGVSAFWERALQGAIILAAVLADAIRSRAAATREAPAVQTAAA
jgi:rhamnose transport system permease protein